MESCSDKVETFLAGVSLNFDQSVCEGTSTFSTIADQSCSSKLSIERATNRDPLISSLREWLHSRLEPLPNDSSLQILKPDPSECLLNFVEATTKALEAVNHSKEDLRQNFKLPQTDNNLPLHFSKHNDFLEMITCLSQIAYKYEDYSMLTSDKVISSLQLHLERQKDIENKFTEIHQVSTITAADTEEVRKKLT